MNRIEPFEMEDVHQLINKVSEVQNQIDRVVVNMEEQTASYDLILMEALLEEFSSNLKWWKERIGRRINTAMDDLLGADNG